MNKSTTAALWLLLTTSLINCTRQSPKVESASAPGPAAVAVAPEAAARVIPVSQLASDSNAAFADDVSFLNQHFVLTDNQLGRFEPTRFGADQKQIVFEYDNTDPGKPKTHAVVSAPASDLDPDSVRTLASWLVVDCKDKKACIVSSDSGHENALHMGAFAQASVDEAAAHLKRILLLQQGKAAPAVVPEPTDEEIAAYLSANVRSTAQIGPFTAFNRVAVVAGDQLIIDQDLLEADTGQRGHLTVKIQLSEANMAVSTGPDVGIACDLAPGQDALADCVSDNAGDQSNNIEIKNIRNAPEVVKMLNRLFLLHKAEESASAAQ
jgi:hypothetical protein